ncbi:heavy metal translocating P-type ATPase [Erythrobacter sp.]|uniref:heavy metal translocating P-type ATPase n=1 Tax=Erythrobacter sp. TaxID=1042 RepID=UPI001B195378|nr:heavy metal translocating P-type ATPase [Erythrobacter sp.]MBO6525532.1 cadmium-translocating P-type ATPase [Erythrobacter sp.]MBO6529795.1 cadmium-translocating P-type ATPase [Erythrobacter sp.]
MNAPVPLDTFDAAVLKDTRFTVPGMRCAGCIAKIERGLADVPGVVSARVNFSSKRVAVRHDATLGEQALVEAIAAIGFEAQAVADNPLARDDKETRTLLRALAVAGFGMMNIMLLSVSVWSGAGGVTRDLFHWLSALIAIPVVAYAGRPFFASAAMALRHRRTNMDVPISIGVLLAIALSIYETATGGEHAYFDGAVMLLFFLLAGRALDATMRDKTRAGIGALLSRMGRSATVLDADGTSRTVSAQDLEPGMLMLVPAGEALAADGVVEEGASTLDNSMLTGESAAQGVAADETVYAGAINLGNPLKVRVTAAASDTALAEIARLMDEAGQSRSQYVRIADRASRLYAPAVHSLALLAFIGWMLAGAGVYQSLVIAIAVLIITCPCAMGLAVPAAQVVASGALAKRGLLVKDGSALERLAEVDLALFDKTGTLTLGEPVPRLDHLSPEQAGVALALARNSRHPLSRGISRALERQGFVAAPVEHIREQGGRGVVGLLGGVEVALERPDGETATLSTSLRIGDDSVIIAFADPVRSDAQEVVRVLARDGIESRIVSGDRAASVEGVARDLDMAWQAQLLPDDKLALLEGLKSAGHRPLMIGDGINDGPALAAAHASIAPGSASDVSQQAADAVFLGKALMPVALAVDVARRTMRIVRQNFAFAILYNVVALPIALAGMVTPLIAALAMSLSSLVVVGNSLRLARAAQ